LCGSQYVPAFRFGISAIRVHNHADRGRAGNELAQQFQSLCAQLTEEKIDAGDVAARPIEAGYEAVTDRITPAGKDNRNGRGRGFGGKCRIEISDDQGHGPAQQIGHQRRQSIKVIVGPAIFDRAVLTLNKT
jgi:hypothetical protein